VVTGWEKDESVLKGEKRDTVWAMSQMRTDLFPLPILKQRIKQDLSCTWSNIEIFVSFR
jgi:hypothetical protein